MSRATQLAFDLTEAELTAAIGNYKKALEEEEFAAASWPHFCSWLGFSESEVEEVIARGSSDGSQYKGRAVLLRRMLTWIRGQILSGNGWSGGKQSLATLALKQDFGDGTAYTERKDTGNSGQQTLHIRFGDDEMSRNAGK